MNYNQYVIIRVDASLIIGAGHVMRCLVMAAELSNNGMTPLFVCRAHQGHMADKIKSCGYEISILPERSTNVEALNYASWLGADWEIDADETIEIINLKQANWVIVDHYGIEIRWEARVKRSTDAKIMIIDGLANRIHEGDILLDPSFSIHGEQRWSSQINKSCKLLVGPHYALLRKEFVSESEKIKKSENIAKRIFVSFGAMDIRNVTFKVLDVILNLELHDINIDVVVGPGNPHISNLINAYGKFKFVQIYVDPQNVAKLMVNADIGISAGGGMLMEQCYLQVPTIVISTAANQVGSALAMHEQGAIHYMGDIGNVTNEEIKNAIIELVKNPKLRRKMKKICKKIMSRPKKSVCEVLLESMKY